MTSDTSVLVALTPARNEVEHLQLLADSILAQTKPPALWVIVNDGSTDGTGELADRLANQHDNIDVVHRQAGQTRQLSSKAHSVEAAYKRAIELFPDADFVASIDGDVELPKEAFETIIDEFKAHPTLGVTGGAYLIPIDGEWVTGRLSPTHVPGPLQVFRREVFDSIGGYRPMRDGGLDVVSTAHARMLGWDTRVTPGLAYHHNRRTGTGGGRHPLSAAYHNGVRDYSLGMSLPFMVAKSIRWAGEDRVLATAALFSGYTKSMVTRRKRHVPADVAKFIRSEQHQRLRAMLRRQDQDA